MNLALLSDDVIITYVTKHIHTHREGRGKGQTHGQTDGRDLSGVRWNSFVPWLDDK